MGNSAQFTLNGQVIEEDGRPVASVPAGANTDTGLRLVGLLNLANRDEGLLDQIAHTISTRNDTPGGQAQPTGTAETPNSYCVILGTPGATPLTPVGPFATEALAKAHADEHAARSPGVDATVDTLVAPENCNV